MPYLPRAAPVAVTAGCRELRRSPNSITLHSRNSSSKRRTPRPRRLLPPRADYFETTRFSDQAARRLDPVVRCPDPADMRPRRGESQKAEPGKQQNQAVMVVAAGVLLPSSCRSVSLKGSEKAEASLPATTHKKFLQKEHDMHEMVGEVAKESNFSKACWRRRLESSISGCCFTQDFSISIYRSTGLRRKWRGSSAKATSDSSVSRSSDEMNDANSDGCHLCCLDGNLLCCDGCPAAFHLKCVGLVEDLLPEGD